MKQSSSLLALLLLLSGMTLLEPRTVAAANTLTISEISSANLTNHPHQFGRAFLPLEIPDFPQILVDGVRPARSQCQVKNRWPDGSVKFAVCHVQIPALAARQSVTLSFENTAQANTQGLTQAEMLHAQFDFEATLRLSNGNTELIASARRMLENNHYTVWASGPAATSIVLADHSVNRTYDLGFDAHRSFRPIFHATFWPGINKVKVRYIGEIANTEAVQDMQYALTLTAGLSAPAVLYQKSDVYHHSLSRFTREFWLGVAPPDVQTNHNTPHLIATRLLPNFDQTKVLPLTMVAGHFDRWMNSNREVFGPGLWVKSMGTGGGRNELGPVTKVIAQLLYSWDIRAEKMARGDAELAAAWPMYIREGNPAKNFDLTSQTGVGYPVTLGARDTFITWDGNGHIRNNGVISARDRLNFVGNFTAQGWGPDCSHQPKPNFVPYLISGEYFFLEQMQFWAAWSAFATNPGVRGYHIGGRNNDQLRGKGHCFQSLAELTALTPDNTLETTYIRRLADDAIAVWEGTFDIRGTTFENTPAWRHGQASISGYWGQQGPSGLGFFGSGNSDSRIFLANQMDPDVTQAATAPWEYGYLTFALGRAKELGLSSDRLLSHAAKFFTGIATDSMLGPYYLTSYQVPTTALIDGRIFSTWSDVRRGFYAAYQPTGFSGFGDTTHGYAHIVANAVSMLTQEPLGAQTWGFFRSVSEHPDLHDDPKFAIVPRSGAGVRIPLLFSMSPNVVVGSVANTVRLLGQDFEANFSGLEINGQLVSRANLDINFVNASELTWNIPANHFPTPSSQTVAVVLSTGAKTNGQILNVRDRIVSGPSLSAVTPSLVFNAVANTILLWGTNFDPTAGVVHLDGRPMAANQFRITNATQAQILLPSGFAVGRYQITLVNGDAQRSNPMQLSVEAPGQGGGGGSGGGNGGGNNNGGGSSGNNSPHGQLNGDIEVRNESGIDARDPEATILGCSSIPVPLLSFDPTLLLLLAAAAVWRRRST